MVRSQSPHAPCNHEPDVLRNSCKGSGSIQGFAVPRQKKTRGRDKPPACPLHRGRRWVDPSSTIHLQSQNRPVNHETNPVKIEYDINVMGAGQPRSRINLIGRPASNKRMIFRVMARCLPSSVWQSPTSVEKWFALDCNSGRNPASNRTPRSPGAQTGKYPGESAVTGSPRGA
jgi:hypothetical protein